MINKNKTKIILGAILIAITIAGSVVFSNAELFQGFIQLKQVDTLSIKNSDLVKIPTQVNKVDPAVNAKKLVLRDPVEVSPVSSCPSLRDDVKLFSTQSNNGARYTDFMDVYNKVSSEERLDCPVAIHMVESNAEPNTEPNTYSFICNPGDFFAEAKGGGRYSITCLKNENGISQELMITHDANGSYRDSFNPHALDRNYTEATVTLLNSKMKEEITFSDFWIQEVNSISNFYNNDDESDDESESGGVNTYY